MLSIIVPVYNVEPYLRRCVDSLLGQSIRDMEIILVDDGSTDNSPAICDEYANKDYRVKVVHKKNEGQSAARNDALKIAKGEYIGFVDSDDWVEYEYCETLLALIKESDMSICSHRIVKGGEKPMAVSCCGRTVRKLDKDELWQEIFCKLNNAVWNKLYKRELLEGISFPLGIYHGEDLLFNLEYIRRCRFASVTDLQLYNYNKRTGSVTTCGFSEKKKLEIVSKDIACGIVEKYYPILLPVAYRYCFRSRLNVLRAIFKSRVQSRQSALISECSIYLKDKFHEFKPILSRKDKLEYFMFMKCIGLYGLLVKYI